MDAKTRFEARIKYDTECADGMTTPCWIFQPKNSNYKGLGITSYNLGNGEIRSIQSASYKFFVGEFPKEKYLLLKCGNRRCVNPDHFLIGTMALARKSEYILDDVVYKICPKCKESFPKSPDNFYISKSGIYLSCKPCSVKSVLQSRVENWARVLWYEAKRRNLPIDKYFLITPEDIMDIYDTQGGRCYWSGIKMSPNVISKFPSKPSLDRLDRFRGYTKDNVVLCCLAINIGRNSSSKSIFEDFMLELKSKGIKTDLWR
jgi:hypothetical protein